MSVRPNRFTLVSAVHLFLVRDDRVLLLRRYGTGYEDGNYSVPAGHVDGGEPVSHAMAREAFEETAVRIEPADLAVVHVMHRRCADAAGDPEERIDFFLVPARWRGEPRIAEPGKCDGLLWCPSGDLPGNTVPYVRHAFDAYREGRSYSEYGWAGVL